MTTYYLRTLGASNIEKATVATRKEVRGHAGEKTSVEAASATVSLSSDSTPPVAKKTYSEAEKKACSIEAMKNGETCEACQ